MSITAGGGGQRRRGTVADVNNELRSLVDRRAGLLTHAEAVQVVPPHVLAYALRRGQLRRVLPGVYQDPAMPAGLALRQRAALAWLDDRGALSHQSALAVWGLHQPDPGEPVQVTVPSTVRLRSRPGVEIHRRSPFAPEPPYIQVRGGLPVTPLDRSLVDAWPFLPAGARRPAVIQAVSDRLTTPQRVAAAARDVPRLTGKAQLTHLLRLLAAGCLSPLEIFGHERVFTGPGMPRFRRQVPIRLGSRRVYLDVYAEAEMVDFELDGASVHADPQQRERDLRRDAQLATRGILVVRFSHHRLVYETTAVQDEILAILARRRGFRLPV